MNKSLKLCSYANLYNRINSLWNKFWKKKVVDNLIFFLFYERNMNAKINFCSEFKKSQ